MTTRTVPSALRELIVVFSRVDAEEVLDRLALTAAAVAGTGCAGLVEVDVRQELARPVRVHVPPGDPLRIRAWLRDSSVLKVLAAGRGPIRLAGDAAAGEPGFLAVPVPLATFEQAYVWAAGRSFDDADEHLLGRFATAAGRALEAARGLEAAVRMLRGVQAFR
ncbi:hypothetical protein [Thermoactinospora rubra]|uniref:hypothetical protein n=1 Tax=Thermoactinospora rubra TaxID=1088767 RepID=UPI00117FE471|nr:hypothetical protein [Thermoactinospora rubra]